MNILCVFVTWWSWCLLFSCFTTTNASCFNDADLERHRCTCNLNNGYIQCSSLPQRCETCYYYNKIFFDENVNVLPPESFQYYKFPSNDNSRLFTIQFTQLNSVSSNAFSKINIIEDQTLSIKISKYTSSTMPSRMFDDLLLEKRSKLDIEIFNVTSPLLTFEQYVFDGIKYGSNSEVRLSIAALKDTLEFKSNTGKTLYVYMLFCIKESLFSLTFRFDFVTKQCEIRIIFFKFR